MPKKPSISNKRLVDRYTASFPFFYRNVVARLLQWRYRRQLSNAQCFVAFLGYPRSGHSIIGALMDAHEEVTISHELDVLALLRLGYSKNRIMGLILAKSRYFFEQGSVWTGYSYRVPDMHQGQFNKMRIIGDKKGGGTTSILKREPEALKAFESLGLPLKFIHVVRNPYDNIVSRARKGSEKKVDLTSERIDKAIDMHLSATKANEQAIESGSYEVLTLRMEDMTRDPKAVLKQIGHFVGYKCDDQYLAACASIVKESTRRKRDLWEWNADQKKRVDALIASTPFLSGYTFDD